MNLSETAFVHAPDGDLFASDTFDLDWFTPTCEVPLCGSATLASAKVLFDEIGVPPPSVRFRTASGVLTATSDDGRIEIDLPRADPMPLTPPVDVPSLLGAPAAEEVQGVPDRGYLLVRYASPEDVAALRPSFADLVRVLPTTHLLIATAPGPAPVDFVSRCFAPWDGIDEDPVTGAAHTVLAPYWGRIGGRSRLWARQLSRRGGELSAELIGPDRVRLGGRADIVIRGYLDLPG